MRERRALPAYFFLAFAISWTGVLLVASRTGLPAPAGEGRDLVPVVLLAMLAGPAIASVLLTALSGGGGALRALARRLGRWRIGLRWYAALLFAPAALVLTLGLFSLGSTRFAPALFSSPSPGTAIGIALAGGVLVGIFEELGWTGFATPRLIERFGWARAGLLLGVVWALWHGLSDYWGGAVYGRLWALHFAQWIVALTAFRLLMTWVYSRCQSLPLGMLLHASFTGGQMLLWPSTAPRDEVLWYGAFAVALWLGLVVVALAVRRSASSRATPGGHRAIRRPVRA